MVKRIVRPALLALWCMAAAAQAQSGDDRQPRFEGFLCCNLRTDGSWISDINYAESGKRILAAGTPAKVTGYGRYRVHVEIDGGRQAIGNDYSRDLDLGRFAQRYVVAADPRLKLATYPEKVRSAIAEARVMTGMTREQVLMAVGYPVSSENPSLESRLWRFWIDSFGEFQVVFDDTDRVKEITAEPRVRNLVVQE